MSTSQQAEPIGSPPAFPSPIMLSPTSMPPAGAPFIPAEFAAVNLPVAGNVKAPEDSTENSTGDNDPSSAMSTGNQLGSPAAQMMAMPNPAVMQGPPRLGMSPLQPPLGMPNPHMRPFPSPQNMQHMPAQMMRGGPMFPPERFRMSMPFPPRGPPFQRFPPTRPEIMDGSERVHFGTERPGFRYPPFQRGRW